MSPTTLTECRWGIIATGGIASLFVGDLLKKRAKAPVNHKIVAIGSSSLSGANRFVDNLWKNSDAPRPAQYDTYQAVFDNLDVDIVYIATPHALHKKNCLDAIAANKNVLCEKPFTINEADAREVVAAAKAKGVFIMEAVWTRFFPMIIALEETLKKGTIGRVRRSMYEIGLETGFWAEQPKTSRLKNPSLGGGALLDICIYPLTFASLFHGEGRLGEAHPSPKVTSHLTIVDGVDESDVVVLTYRDDDGFEHSSICLASVHDRMPLTFGRIEGTEGSIKLITDKGPSCPRGFVIKTGTSEEEFNFYHEEGAMGFYHEADAVAADIAAGRKENERMPLSETIRMMHLMDKIRQQNGLVYPQDQQ